MYQELPRIHRMAEQGDAEAVRRCLDDGIDVDLRNEYGGTPLMWAVGRRAFRVVRLLLERGADPNAASLHSGTPLHSAVGRGHERIVRMLIEAGADVNAPLRRADSDEPGQTPLMSALSNNRLEVARLLLDAGADANYSLPSGETPYRTAALSMCRPETLHLLREYGAHVDPAENLHWFQNRGFGYVGGPTPAEVVYMLRATLGALGIDTEAGDGRAYLESIRERLTRPAQVWSPARNGNDDLVLNAHYESAERIRQLLDAGAEVEQRDEQGYTALIAAAYEGREDTVRLLLERGADPGARTYDGSSGLELAAMNDHVRIVEMLLDAGVDVNERDTYGETLLIGAAGSWSVQTARLLLDRGADPNGRGDNRFSRTPLIAAVFDDGKMWERQAEMLQLLIDHGADVNATDAEGRTALSYAVAQGREDLAAVLIMAGATIDLTEAAALGGGSAMPPGLPDEESAEEALYGEAPFEEEPGWEEVGNTFAEQERWHRYLPPPGDVAAKALAGGNGSTEEFAAALIAAICSGHMATARDLLASIEPVVAAVVNHRNALGHTALCHAVFCDEADDRMHISSTEDAIAVTQLLLEYGADPNVRLTSAGDQDPFAPGGWGTELADTDGATLLMYAAARGKIESVRTLLAGGARVDLADHLGRTPLHYASRRSRFSYEPETTEISALLLSQGADPNARNAADGWTPLIEAAYNGDALTAQLLLQWGAQVDIADADGRTALDWALWLGHDAVCRVLRAE